MLSIQQTKELLGEPNMSNEEAKQIRSRSYKFADLIINRWLDNRTKLKNIENKYKDYDKSTKR